MTRGAYAAAVMKALDVPHTVHNRRAFMAWYQTEGGEAKNNPANTTEEAPGATDYNWVGVKNYPTAAAGVAANVRTFKGKGHGYEAILHCFRTNAPASKTLTAIGRSDWGTGGTLAMTIRAELARIPSYLRVLESKEIAS